MATNSVSREYNLLALTAAGAGMPRETLRFSNDTGSMLSATVDNGSNCDCGVFLNRDPFGTPSFIVPAGTFKTQPIQAQILGITFAPPVADQPRGTAYVQASDEPLAASSGVSAAGTTTTAVWDSSQWDSGAKAGP